MKATDIIAQARSEIKDFITYETKYLYMLIHKQFPNWEKDEEYVIDIQDIFDGKVKVTLNVFINEDETIKEQFELSKIKVTLDDNLFFTDIYLEEYHYGELMIDELGEIGDMLEEAVLKKINDNSKL